MKTTFTSLLLFLALSSQSFAQNCQNPISPAVFQTGFNSVALQQGDPAKLIRATRFTSDKCMSASQVKMIALLFATDSARLDYCKSAYAHTVDPANYYDVYDAFRAFSAALRLYNYVEHYTGPTAPAPAAQVSFPNYAYPDTLRYVGKKGCAGPAMNATAFQQAAQNVFAQPTDESKLVAVQDIAARNCLTFAQAMKLAALLQADNFRLRVLTTTFPSVYDQEHYPSGVVLFSTTQLQNEWTTYARSYLAPPPVICKATDEEFKQVLTDVQAKNFAAEQMSILELVAKDRCFSVAQIRTLATQFPFGRERIKVYKLFYAKCHNQKDYYQVVDDLTFPDEKAEMRRYIAAGGK